MKKNSSIVLPFIFVSMLFLASCAKDEASDPTNPQTDKFIGNWQISEDSKLFGKSTYNLVITEDATNTSQRFISYLYSFKTKITATVSGNNISIAKQLIEGQNVSGKGVLANNTQLNLTYYVQSTATKYDTVTAVLTK